jgi:integrase
MNPHDIPDGSYYAEKRAGVLTGIIRWDVMVDGTRYRGRGPSRRAAKADGLERMGHVRAGRVDGRPETVGVMLEAWLSEAIEPFYPLGTLQSYSGIVRNHLVPAVGELPAHQVRPADLNAAYRAVAAAGYTETVRTMKTVAGAAYTWAVGEGRVAGFPPGSLWNPGLTSRVPKDLPGRGSRTAPTSEQVDGLLAVTDPTFNGAVWRVMAECALRPSEAAGLRWTDWYPDDGVIQVRGALRRDRSLGVYTWHRGTKKTTDGERGVAVSPQLSALLRRQRTDLLALQLASRWVSDAWAGELIFRKATDGRAVDSRRLEYELRVHHLPAAGVEPFSPYQLRHYEPTRMARAGHYRETIGEFMGNHPDTARRYYIDRPDVAVPAEAMPWYREVGE